jgi:S1-C subfamily serine protease
MTVKKMTSRFSLGQLFVGGALALLVGPLCGHADTVTGTGFAVTADGIVITNNHVISDCDATIRARIEGSASDYFVATVIARDVRRDLAALKLQRRVGQDSHGPIQAMPRVTFRQGPAVQQGEKAITYGFPLHGLLATNGNLTLGYVSALTGLGDDRDYIQITTPVQRGNSGGPLYDGSGHVIGVVVAKLNALSCVRRVTYHRTSILRSNSVPCGAFLSRIVCKLRKRPQQANCRFPKLRIRRSSAPI